MLVSWKRGVYVSIDEVLSEINPIFTKIFQENIGLDQIHLEKLIKDLGLLEAPPMSLSVDGMAQLLTNNGPIWINVDEDKTEKFQIHAKIVIGLNGDGSPAGTVVEMIDPYPYSQSIISEVYSSLQESYDQLAIGDTLNQGHLARFIHF